MKELKKMGKSKMSSSKKVVMIKGCDDDDDDKNHDVVMMKKGPWTPEEDQKLLDFIQNNNGNPGNWRSLPNLAGLQRCGKSCRLRWSNYLRPDIKRGPFSEEEDKKVFQLHALLGNRWAAIATRLPGRTDNDVKNYWNTHLKKRKSVNIDPEFSHTGSHLTRHMVQWESIRLETEARLSIESLLNPSLNPITSCDHFLRLWHSDAGESFRRNDTRTSIEMGRVSASPTSGSSTRCGSESGVTGQVEQPVTSEMQLKEAGYLSGSDESGDFSDVAMNLLLDSPTND